MMDIQLSDSWEKEVKEDTVEFVFDLAKNDVDAMHMDPSSFAAMAVQDDVGEMKEIQYDAPEIQVRVVFQRTGRDAGPILSESQMDEKARVQEAMAERGGSFCQQLGNLLARADSVNTRKIKHTFPDYWQQYDKLGREFQ